MLFLAHAGVAAFMSQRLGFSVGAAVVASWLPDFFDKGAFLLGFASSSRWLGHTLLFSLIAAIAFFFFVQHYRVSKKAVFLSALVGILSHFLLDSGAFLPLFYPFVSYDFPVTEELVREFSFFEIGFEFVGLFLLLLVNRERVKRLRK